MFTDFKISYVSDGVKTEHTIDVSNYDLVGNLPYYLATAVGKSAKDAEINPDIFLEQLAYELEREIEINNPYEYEGGDEDEDEKEDEDEDDDSGEIDDSWVIN